MATGKYIEYFEDLYMDLTECSDFVNCIDIILLTDQNYQIDKRARLEKIRIQIQHAEFENWTLATLMRFKEIIKYKNILPDQNTIWLDADMRIVNPKEFCEQIAEMNSMTFARHPGFVFSLTKFWNFGLLRTLKTLLTYFGFLSRGQIFNGPWENNRESLANVKPISRRRYIHGAIWGGPKSDFINMCEELDRDIDHDLENGIVAIWHDESHINRYLSSNRKLKYFSKHFSGADNLTPRSGRNGVWSVDKGEVDKL
jgi:hypothetical protein